MRENPASGAIEGLVRPVRPGSCAPACDPLTSLMPRDAFVAAVTGALAEASSGQSVGLMVLDVENKVVFPTCMSPHIAHFTPQHPCFLFQKAFSSEGSTICFVKNTPGGSGRCFGRWGWALLKRVWALALGAIT